MRVVRKCRMRLWRAALGLSFCVLIFLLVNLFLPQPPVKSTYGVSRPLPLHYWYHMRIFPENYRTRACASFPNVSDLFFEAAFWQRVNLDFGNIYIYAAYWDDRVWGEAVVRLLIYSEITPVPKLICQLWYLNDARPYSVAANATYAWLSEWEGPINGVTEPYILTCPTTPTSGQQWEPNDPRHSAPRAVSITTKPCQPASNAFAIQDAPKLNFTSLSLEESIMLENDGKTEVSGTSSVGVCLTGLVSEDDISPQLVEWLELAKAFGAETVYVYLIHVHPNVRLALDYYRYLGLVDITDVLHLPSSYSTPAGLENNNSYVSQRMLYTRRQLLPYNDCLYRSIHRHQWITILDLNEMIVPSRDLTWLRLIEEEAKEETFNILVVDKLYFANRMEKNPTEVIVEDDKEEDVFRTVRRHHPRILNQKWAMPVTSSERGTNEISFQNTSSMLTMHNQMPFACRDDCNIRYVESDQASVHRYTSTDAELCGALHLPELTCRENMAALRYNEDLHRWGYIADKVNNVLYKLDLL